ncbi:hypothetical protein [Bdellovibrio bacteriovorus]|uniref:hypothetical protein n=1 Tax=Bdellovibrio bacteriovorus TaxID=959 RepID=UPI0035A8EB1A
MKNAVVLSVLTFGLSLSASADPQPWLAMVGNYTIPETCKIDYEDGFTKARIQVVRGGQEIELTAYKGSDSATQYIPVGNFQRPASGTDGDVFYSVKDMTGTSFVATEHFVRKGSDTWPDLEMLETYSLSLQDGVLTLVQTHQDSYKKSAITKQTCVLTALQDANEITAEDIEVLADRDLEKLSKAADIADASGMDLDQAAFQLGKFQMNKTNPTKDELKEVLALHATLSDVDVELRVVRTAKPEATAAFALKTALNIVEAATLKTPEYKSLRDLKKAMIDILTLKKSNLKAILVKWSHSDADGEGLLLIDESTGQALYIGSGYFS